MAELASSRVTAVAAQVTHDWMNVGFEIWTMILNRGRMNKAVFSRAQHFTVALR